MKKLIEWKKNNWDKLYLPICELLSLIVMFASCISIFQGNYDVATVGVLIAIYGQIQAKK